MFNLRVAEYIKTRMHQKGMTYKELEEKSGVPLSTLHSYASAKVTKHTNATLEQIAEAFGDSKSVIQEMRNKSEESYEQEQKLLKESENAKQMEQFAALIRSNVSQILEEYREQALAQQIETSRHADGRVKIAEQKAEERVAEIERKTGEAIADMKRRCEEREAAYKQHCAELMEAERRGFNEVHDHDGSNSVYLRVLVRNLTIALVVFVLITFCLGTYAVYAFTHYDYPDPTTGITSLIQ